MRRWTLHLKPTNGSLGTPRSHRHRCLRTCPAWLTTFDNLGVAASRIARLSQLHEALDELGEEDELILEDPAGKKSVSTSKTTLGDTANDVETRPPVTLDPPQVSFPIDLQD